MRTLFLFLWLASIINGPRVFSPTPTPTPPAGILNGGFESYTGTQDDGTTDTFTSWTNVPYAGGYIDATATAHGGTNALVLHTTTGGDCPGFKQDVAVVASTNYRLTFWTRTNIFNAANYGVYDVTHSSDIRAYGSTGVTSLSYTLVTYDFTTPAGCTSIQVYFFGSSLAGSSCYFDDLSLVLN